MFTTKKLTENKIDEYSIRQKLQDLGFVFLIFVLFIGLYYIFFIRQDFTSKLILKDVSGFSLYESKDKFLYVSRQKDGLEIGNYDLVQNEKKVIKFVKGDINEGLFIAGMPVRSKDGRFFFWGIKKDGNNILFEVKDNNLEEIEKVIYPCRNTIKKIEEIKIPYDLQDNYDLQSYYIVTTPERRVVGYGDDCSGVVGLNIVENVKNNHQVILDYSKTTPLFVDDNENDLKIYHGSSSIEDFVCLAWCNVNMIVEYKGKKYKSRQSIYNDPYFPFSGNIITSKGDLLFMSGGVSDLYLLTPRDY